MKKTGIILIIALCLLVLVLPVMAVAEEQGNQTGGTAVNDSQNHGEKNGIAGAEGNDPSATPTGEMTRGYQQDVPARNGNTIADMSRNDTPGTTPGEMFRGNQQDVSGGDRNNPADMSRNDSRIPELKNESRGDQVDYRYNTSTLPPGWVKNPNEVRDTVRSMLAMENRTGGIGPQVSAIAREFNNSADASRQYEDRINNRDPISRFFFGGDKQAAAELANLTAQNQARITEIENLMATTTMDAETRSQMEMQLQTFRMNLAYDQMLAARAQQDRGIFG